MQEFIQMAASKLGVDEDAISSASGSLLGMLRDSSDAGDFSKLLDKLPGAEALVEQSSAGGGLLGGLGSELGGSLGGAAGALGALQRSGLGSEQLGSLASMLIEFAKGHAGEDLVGRLLEKAPALKSLLG